MVSDKIIKVAEIADKGCQIYYDVIPALIRERGYEYGIEIGVFTGGHSKAILDNTNLYLLIGVDPYKFYSMNPPGMESQDDYNNLYRFAMARLSSNRYTHYRLGSDEAFPMVRDFGSIFDFVFIDGLHTYEQVKKDLDNYGSLVKTGGVIACHDYNHPNFPLVTNAIDEYAAYHNAEIIICPFHAIYMEKTW